MTARWRKVFRDFSRERGRAALVVLAIAIGIAGFSTVMSAYAILTRELDRGYLETSPASATLWTDTVDDRLLAAVRAHPGVKAAEPRRAIRGRIQTGPMAWRNAVLFVVPDYGAIRISTVAPQEGAWPPGKGEILIERDAVQVAKTRIGKNVTFKTENGTSKTLRVTGTVHDVGQAQARMENIVYGYITLETLAVLGEEPFLDQVKIVVTGDHFDRVHIERVVASVQQTFTAAGHPVRRFEVPAPGKHPHSEIMGMLLLTTSAFGLFVLALSGIIVLTLMMALMAAQVRQIAVMKTIGATRAQVAVIYLAQALVLGVCAVALGIPAGMFGSRLLCRAMAVFLNFDLSTFAVPLWVYLLDIALGLLVPVLAAAYPVWKGSAVSIREALADFGLSQTSFGATRFDRALMHVSGAARPLLLAIRNSFRRRLRFALTVLTLSAGGLFFMTALNTRASLIETLDRLFRQRRYDLVVSLGPLVPRERIENAVRNTAGVRQYEVWITSEGSFARDTASGLEHDGLHAPRRSGSGFTIVALPEDTQLLHPDIEEGRALRRDTSDEIVVNGALAAKYPQLKVGRTVTFQMGPAMTTWRVVGVTREPLTPPAAYISRAFFDARHPGLGNSIRIALARTDAESVNRFKADLERNLLREDIRRADSLSTADSRVGFDAHMVMIYVNLVIMSAVILLVGGLGLATTMSLNVLERRREMGVLHTIGATPRMVSLLVVTEGCFIGIVSWVVATTAAWPVSNGIANLVSHALFRGGLAFRFDWSGVAVWLVASLLLSAMATFVPAWRASRQPIAEALGCE